MSKNCSNCSKCCVSPFNGDVRPRSGVLTTNKVVAKHCIVAPYICGPNGTVNVAGVELGGDTIDLNSGLVIGDKSTFTTGLITQTNDNGISGTWDVINLNDSASSTNLLAGSIDDNCLYIGGDEEFVGFNYQIDNEVVGLSSASSWQYWNGTAWAPMQIMASQSVLPYNQYANTPFERVSADVENVRIAIVDDWTQLELNGSTKYWLRLRLTDDTTGVPSVSSFNLLASHQVVAPNGFTEYFGEAELERELVFHRNLLESVNASSPSDKDIDLTGTFSIDAKDNSFNDGVDDNMGGVFRIPKSTSTESGMTVCIAWYPNENLAGDVEVGIEYTSVKEGDILDGTLLSKTVKLVQTVVLGDQKKLSLFQFKLPIEDVKPYEMIAVRFFRDARAGNVADTYADDIVVADISAVVKYWK